MIKKKGGVGMVYKRKLYEKLDQEEDMSDSEKREAYFAELANLESDEDLEDGYEQASYDEEEFF